MLPAIESVDVDFEKINEKSNVLYKNELNQLHDLVLINRLFFNDIRGVNAMKQKTVDSLAIVSMCESVRLSAHIKYLTSHALYKNAYDNIRFIIESIIQSTYIDLKHPTSSLETKLEIWKEVENSRDYHAQVVIGKLDLGKYREQRARLEKEYKNLSQKIHYSHKHIMSIIKDLTSKDKRESIPSRISREEIIEVYDSLSSAYDILFFLCIVAFPELEQILDKDKQFIEAVKKFQLPILSHILKED